MTVAEVEFESVPLTFVQERPKEVELVSAPDDTDPLVPVCHAAPAFVTLQLDAFAEDQPMVLAPPQATVVGLGVSDTEAFVRMVVDLISLPA